MIRQPGFVIYDSSVRRMFKAPSSQIGRAPINTLDMQTGLGASFFNAGVLLIIYGSNFMFRKDFYGQGT